MKGIIAWFASNRVAANLLTLFFILTGVMAVFSIKKEVFPNVELDKIAITIVYPGAAPIDIEESAVVKIERALSGLSGVKEIRSIAREGRAKIIVEILKDWNVKSILDEIKAKVEAVDTFPQDMEKPVVKQEIDIPQVLNAAVFGDVPEAALKKSAEDIRDDIVNLPGVTMARLRAVRDEEIHVEISEKELRKYNITLGMAADIIGKESLDLPGGKIRTENREILIRTKGKRYRAEDYNEIALLSKNDGGQVKLGQIASISEAFEDNGVSFVFNGKPAAMIQVFRIADQNALKIAESVKEYIKNKRLRLPDGIDIKIFDDKSVILEKRVNLLLKNMLTGLVLVCAILAVFLGVRLSFWVALGIPVSFMFAISFLSRLDVSINMFSLFAFILVLGIVVDDAIIVGESIFEKRELGLSPLDAATKGVLQVANPVIFAGLTTMAAFWPMFAVGGFIGKLMRNIPAVVILVIVGSLIESFLILPSHLAGINSSSRVPAKERLVSSLLKKFINGPYFNMLRFCLNWRYPVIALGFCALLIIFGLSSAGALKFVFFPKVEGDIVNCHITMPAGASAGKLREVMGRLEKAALEALEEASRGDRDILKHKLRLAGLRSKGTMGLIAESDSNQGQIWLRLVDADKRKITASEFVEIWRKKAGAVTEAKSIEFVTELHSAGADISVYLSMENSRSLVSAAEELKRQISAYNGTFDISDSLVGGKKTAVIELKPEAAALGISLDELASQARAAFWGAEALRFQRGDNEVKIITIYPEHERQSLRNIETMRIRAENGAQVPLSSIAEIRLKDSLAVIQRSRGKRVVNVRARVNDKTANAGEIRNNLEKKYLPELKRKFPGLRYYLGGSGRKQSESIRDLQKGLVIALFVIYALLAVSLKSFAQPLVILATIPFGVGGAAIGHLLMGYDLSILSFFGIAGLIGVVINDSLVLTDLVNLKIRQKGLSAYNALLEAGPQRFRAIVLTSTTTFVGLAPIMLETDAQAQFLIPMAISLAFGALFAALTTSLFIPCVYMVLNDINANKI